MVYKPEFFVQEMEFPMLLILHDREHANFIRHWHAEIELNYTAVGSIDAFYIEGDTYQTTAGDLLYVNPYEVHGVRNFKNHEQEEIGLSVIIPTPFIERYCPVMKNYRILARKLNADLLNNYAVYQELIFEFNALLALAAKKPDDINNLRAVASVTKILALYLENFSEKKVDDGTANIDERIQKIITYVHNHYTQELKLSDIAAECHLTESYLSRYFKKRLGLTLFQYVEMIRSTHAIEELKKNEKSVEEIADQTGFADAKAMNKCLKKIYGKTAKYFKRSISVLK